MVSWSGLLAQHPEGSSSSLRSKNVSVLLQSIALPTIPEPYGDAMHPNFGPGNRPYQLEQSHPEMTVRSSTSHSAFS